jgi:hypothetical protein
VVCKQEGGGTFHGHFENARLTTISCGANTCTDGVYLSAGEAEQTSVAFEGQYREAALGRAVLDRSAEDS